MKLQKEHNIFVYGEQFHRGNNFAIKDFGKGKLEISGKLTLATRDIIINAVLVKNSLRKLELSESYFAWDEASGHLNHEKYGLVTNSTIYYKKNNIKKIVFSNKYKNDAEKGKFKELAKNSAELVKQIISAYQKGKTELDLSNN